jgi:hypothetical protein
VTVNKGKIGNIASKLKRGKKREKQKKSWKAGIGDNAVFGKDNLVVLKACPKLIDPLQLLRILQHNFLPAPSRHTRHGRYYLAHIPVDLEFVIYSQA